MKERDVYFMLQNRKVVSLAYQVFSSFHVFFLQLEEPDEGCIRPSEDVYCFLAGDPRVNEQTVHPPPPNFIIHIFLHISTHKFVAVQKSFWKPANK